MQGATGIHTIERELHMQKLVGTTVDMLYAHRRLDRIH